MALKPQVLYGVLEVLVKVREGYHTVTGAKETYGKVGIAVQIGALTACLATKGYL
jgi:hypothetical protein